MIRFYINQKWTEDPISLHIIHCFIIRQRPYNFDTSFLKLASFYITNFRLQYLKYRIKHVVHNTCSYIHCNIWLFLLFTTKTKCYQLFHQILVHPKTSWSSATKIHIGVGKMHALMFPVTRQRATAIKMHPHQPQKQYTINSNWNNHQHIIINWFLLYLIHNQQESWKGGNKHLLRG